jgi:hypothetical protein
MARENKPMSPRERGSIRESGPMGDSRERGKNKADEEPKPSLPEQNRKLGRRHD